MNAQRLYDHENTAMKPWEEDETFLSRWLTNDLSEEELREFEASPEYEAYVKAAGALDQFELKEYDAPKVLEQMQDRIARSEQRGTVRSLRPLSLVYYAAAAVLVLALGIFIYAYLFPRGPVEITARGIEKAELPDGSLVTLNHASTVSYDKGGWTASRSVVLRGEAFFEVEKGSTFDVFVGKSTVTVLGTRFNVRHVNDTLSVTCYEGKVRVKSKPHSYVLTAGDGVVIPDDGEAVTQKTALVQPRWTSTTVQVENLALGDVLQQIEEIYGLEIVGAVDRNRLFSGAFPTNNAEVALKQVLGPFDIQYRLDPSSKTVVIE